MTARELRAGSGRYLINLAVAWPGVMAVIFGCAILTGAVWLKWLDPLIEPPVFPLQLAAAFLLGLALNRHFSSRVACWVWIPPLAILAWDVSNWANSPAPLWDRTSAWRDVWNNYFGTQCQGSECLNELLLTGPFYTAVLYSLGAWAALRWPRRNRDHASSQSAPSSALS